MYLKDRLINYFKNKKCHSVSLYGHELCEYRTIKDQRPFLMLHKKVLHMSLSYSVKSNKKKRKRKKYFSTFITTFPI